MGQEKTQSEKERSEQNMGCQGTWDTCGDPSKKMGFLVSKPDA